MKSTSFLLILIEWFILVLLRKPGVSITGQTRKYHAANNSFICHKQKLFGLYVWPLYLKQTKKFILSAFFFSPMMHFVLLWPNKY